MVEDLEDTRRRRPPAEPPGCTKHHPIFDQFEFPIRTAEPGWYVDFLGVRTRIALHLPHEQPADSFTRRHVATGPPGVNEEYFEWIAVMEAATEARGSFTMIELGAGWGRWLAIGAVAAKQISGIPIRLVGVEPEPQHYKWMEQHLSDNGINRDERELIRAAVAAVDGYVWFHVGASAHWYGQSIAERPVPSRGRVRVTRLGQGLRRWLARDDEPAQQIVPAVSLLALLRPHERVDLIDLDIQGAEADVIEPAAGSVDSKVRRVHIGTHSGEAEARLRTVFGRLGWECIHDFPAGGASETPWGPIQFEDGVQTWLNPRLERQPAAGASGLEPLQANTSD